MKKSIFATFGAMLFLCALNAQNHAQQLTNELMEFQKQSILPGFAVSIISEDKILYQKGFGYADKKNKKPFSENTIINLGSVTKTVVGVALVKAIEEGHFTMDSKINHFLPFQIENPRFKNSPISIRQLATHTSSLTDSRFYRHSYVLEEENRTQEHLSLDYLNFIKKNERLSLEVFIKNILHEKGKWYKKKNFLKVQPGAQKEYANINAALAAYIIEVTSGIPFDKYATEKILEPLKMDNSGWSFEKINEKNHAVLYFPRGEIVPKYSLITYPDGGLLSSVSDMSLYLMEIIKCYNGNSDFLNEKYSQLLLPGDEDTERAFWGMNPKSKNIGHGGSDPGVQSRIQFNPDSKTGRVILCNTNAEDNEAAWADFQKIHTILNKYENMFLTTGTESDILKKL